MRFTPEKLAFELRSDQPLPDGLAVRVTGDGVEETVRSGGIQGVGTNKGVVESPLAFGEGEDYRVEVLVAGEVVASRAFTFHDEGSFEPRNDVRATYDMTMRESDASSDLNVAGTAHLELRDGILSTSMDGSGTMIMDDDGFRMTMNIGTFSMAQQDDVVTGGQMRGTGTWSVEEPEMSGSGTIPEMRIDFLGMEAHRDGQGATVEAEKERMFMQMEGTMHFGGDSVHMEMEMDETTWLYPETGLAFWRQGYEETTYTAYGESYPERSDFDEAVTDEGDEPALSDMLPESGPTVWPLATGDTFVHEGTDVRVEYQVKRGGPQTVDRNRVSTWVLEGHAVSGATGTQTMAFVGDGFLEGLPLSIDQSFTQGDLRAGMTMDLLRVA